MHDMAVGIEAYGLKKAADIAVCDRVHRILQSTYPGHPWSVGCNHESGHVVIALRYPELSNFPWNYMLRISTVDGPDGDHRVRLAGGEWLERWGLARGARNPNTMQYAKQNGLDVTGAIWKSKH